jgi:hypothetical protein
MTALLMSHSEITGRDDSLGQKIIAVGNTTPKRDTLTEDPARLII